MPLFHVYDDDIGLLATVASGIVTERQMADSRDRATQRCGGTPPGIILIDLAALRDCPKMFKRSVLSLMRMQVMFQAAGRVGQLVLRAEPGTLGWGIGRIYLAQDALMEWVEISLVESDAELAAKLNALAPAGMAPIGAEAPAAGCVDRLLAEIGSRRGG